MSGAHTIFDTRRLNRDDNSLPGERTAEETATLLEMDSKNASAFLAERGELSSAVKQNLRH